MKLNKAIILFIFMVFLVGVSFVSAENIEDTSDLSAVDTDDAISVDDVSDLSVVDTDDAIFTDEPEDNVAIDESDVPSNSRSSTTVYNWNSLGSEVYYNNYDTIYLGANITPGNQISIRHSVTIVGSSDTYVGGSSPSTSVSYSDIPIVTGANGLSVTFKNIKFKNCGGNTLMKLAGNGNFILDNCTFENISASGTKTVVVHLNYGTCDIINCTFDNCLSDYGTVSNYKTDSEPQNVHMIVRDTTFKNNYATTEPGGINNCGFLTVYNSTFVNNSAVKWAGAIHTHYSGTTTIYGSNFIDNFAGWNGGALYAYNSLTVIDSNFTNNRATSNGGAIAASYYMTMPRVTIENCEFNNNLAGSNGGAISFSSGILIVDDSKFNNNLASGSGGALYAASVNTLNISDCEFINNKASSNGGAIFNSKCKANVIDCFFKNNTATTAKGGAIYATGKSTLNVDYCVFLNNSAVNDNSGHALAYYYSGNSATAAYLTYTNNQFYGPNNGVGSVYIANNNVNIVQYNNTITDYSNYTEPIHVIIIPDGADLGNIVWNLTFDDEDCLSGNPVIVGNYILIPANHTLYCYYTNGTYVWDVFSGGAGCFCGLIVENGIVYAPCEGDKLYILDLDTGDSLTNASILEGSSFYAPVMYNNTLYICSENGYGADSNLWITMVKYENGDYVYYSSILEINGVPIYSQAMLSEPIIYGNCLYVNTVNGLVRYNLADNTMTSIAGTIGNPVIDSNGNICVLRNVSGSTYLCLLDSSLNVVDSELLNGDCNQLVSDGAGNVYTVDTNGYIHYASYTGSSISCDVTSFNINPVSSAITCSGNYLYIGDDAGILWVFNINLLDYPLDGCLSWAFNATSPIVGNILVDNLGNVYVGNDNGDFYAVNSA